MPRKPLQEKTRLLSKVSNLYYIQSHTQQEIAEKLGLSRPMISRLLKQAREEGIVQINVLPPPGIYHELEYSLEQKYGLKEAVVIETEAPYTQLFVTRQIGLGATEYFLRTAKSGDIIGLTWGTTLQAFVASMRRAETEGVHVVQILGGLGPPESDVHPGSICSRLASLLGCTFTLLPSPGVAGSKETKGAYLSDAYVANALKIIKKVNVAYVGVGSLAHDALVVHDNIITPEEREYLLHKGAVGDIGLRYFDVHGNPVESNFDERVIGASLAQIKQYQRVVGLVGGPDKFEPVLGVLRGKYINVLITDFALAQKLVDAV